MSKKTKKIEHEVVVKAHCNAEITQQMTKWLVEHGVNYGEALKWHDKRLVECVKELNPENFRVVKISSNKYVIVETHRDCVLLTPEDIEELKKEYITIDEESEDSVRN